MTHAATGEVKVRITRAWTKLAPKLIAFLATGLTATGVIQVAAQLGFELNTGLANLIVVVVSAIAGYIKTDTALVGGDAASSVKAVE